MDLVHLKLDAATQDQVLPAFLMIGIGTVRVEADAAVGAIAGGLAPHPIAVKPLRRELKAQVTRIDGKRNLRLLLLELSVPFLLSELRLRAAVRVRPEDAAFVSCSAGAPRRQPPATKIVIDRRSA